MPGGPLRHEFAQNQPESAACQLRQTAHSGRTRCLQTQIDVVKKLQTETAAELDAMLPAILDKAFKGGL